MKVLIVKTSSLGDIVHAFSALGLLKKIVSHAEIDWVVEEPSKGLLMTHPDVRRVITINTKTWRKSLLSSDTRKAFSAFKHELQQENYDLVIDLQGNSKSGLITWLAKSPVKIGFGRRSVPEWPNLLATNHRYEPIAGQDIRSDYQQLIRAHFGYQEPYEYPGVQLALNEVEQAQLVEIAANFQQSLPKVLVCPGSNWKNKQLTDETLEELLIRLQQHSPSQILFVWGSPEEKALAHALSQKIPSSQVLEKMSLPLLQNVMEAVDLVIAMDSLALHLAATTSTATFSIFGPSLAAKYKPPGKQHIAYQGSCPYNKQFDKRCPILRTCSTGACMRALDTDKLFAALKAVLTCE